MGAGSLARLEEEGEGPGSWIQQAWLKKQTQKHYIFILREKWQRHTAGLEDHDTHVQAKDCLLFRCMSRCGEEE